MRSLLALLAGVVVVVAVVVLVGRGDEGVLVVLPASLANEPGASTLNVGALSPNDSVRVTGMVQPFDPAVVREPSDDLTSREGDPAIVVTEATLIREDAADRQPESASIEELARRAGEQSGSTVTVSGDVVQTFGSSAFTLVGG